MHWPWQTAEVKKFGRFASKIRTSSNISALIFSSTSPHSPSSTAAENQTRNGNSIRKTIAKWLRLQRPNNSNKSSDVKKQNHGRSRYKLTGMGIKPNLYTYPSTIKSMLMLWHTKLIYWCIWTQKSTYILWSKNLQFSHFLVRILHCTKTPILYSFCPWKIVYYSSNISKIFSTALTNQ